MSSALVTRAGDLTLEDTGICMREPRNTTSAAPRTRRRRPQAGFCPVDERQRLEKLDVCHLPVETAFKKWSPGVAQSPREGDGSCTASRWWPSSDGSRFSQMPVAEAADVQTPGPPVRRGRCSAGSEGGTGPRRGSEQLPARTVPRGSTALTPRLPDRWERSLRERLTGPGRAPQ